MTKSSTAGMNGKSGVSRRKLPAKPAFVQLPMWTAEDPKLSDREIRALAAVLSFAWERKDGSRNPCCASLGEIGARAGDKGRDAVREALKSLVAKGILTAEVEAENMPTIYRLAEPERFGRGWRNRHGGVAISPGGGVAESPYKVEEEKVEKGSSSPLTPAARGSQNQKPGGTKVNPRAEGTSPRQIGEAWDAALAEDDYRKRRAHRAWREETDPDPPPDGQDEERGQGEAWEAWKARQPPDPWGHPAGPDGRHKAYRWIRRALKSIERGEPPDSRLLPSERNPEGFGLPRWGGDWEWIARTLQAYADGTLPERVREFIDNPPKFEWSTPSGRLPHSER